MKRNRYEYLNLKVPHERRNKLLICIGYGFTGINCIVSSVCTYNHTGSDIRERFILFGIIMLGMVPLSYFDTRKEMHMDFMVIIDYVMYFLIMCFISKLYSSWKIMILFVVEVLVLLFSLITVKHVKRIRKKK